MSNERLNRNSPEKRVPDAENLIQFETRQNELFAAYAADIAASVEIAERDGKNWLDLGSVNEELKSFFTDVRKQQPL